MSRFLEALLLTFCVFTLVVCFLGWHWGFGYLVIQGYLWLLYGGHYVLKYELPSVGFEILPPTPPQRLRKANPGYWERPTVFDSPKKVAPVVASKALPEDGDEYGE